MKVGDIGGLRDTSMWVVQIIDKSTVLVKPNERMDVCFWMSGIPTKELVDDSHMTRNEIFEVVGTKKYTTVMGGSSTLFELSPYKISDPAEYIASLEEEKHRAENDAKKKVRDANVLAHKASEEAKRKTWTSANGTFSVEATLWVLLVSWSR